MMTLRLLRMMLSFSLLLLLLLRLRLLLLPPPHASSSSTLELSVGIRVSPVSSFNRNPPPYYRKPMSNAPLITFGIPAFGLHAVFMPILSSPSFQSSKYSSRSPGFSFGFFFNYSSGLDFDIYLAVCGGYSGNFWNLSVPHYFHLSGANDTKYRMVSKFLPGVRDGYAVPVWIANPFTSLKSVKASLAVVEAEVGGSKQQQLQLQDFDGKVLWKVSNVGLMEMEDTGHLTIYNTIHKTNVVWQSPLQYMVGEVVYNGLVQFNSLGQTS